MSTSFLKKVGPSLQHFSIIDPRLYQFLFSKSVPGYFWLLAWEVYCNCSAIVPLDGLFKRKKIHLKFFVVKRSFFTTFVDITTLLSALFAINFRRYFNNLFTLVMSPLIATRIKSLLESSRYSIVLTRLSASRTPSTEPKKTSTPPAPFQKHFVIYVF
jgi:hypothetical protein